MKTKLLFASFLFFITITTQAQIGEVWSWNFNDNGISDETMGDWTFDQAEASTGPNWIIKTSEYDFIYGVTDGDMVLSSQIALAEGDYDRWAITPAIDLSFYAGTKMSFKYLKGFFEIQATDHVEIYAAATPDMELMLANGPIASVELEGDFNDPLEIITKEVEIPSQYNLQTVYFAIRHKWEASSGQPKDSQALEITEVEFTAEELAAGLDEVVKNNFILKQNPVAETLELQTGNLINTENTQLSIYTTTGQLVKQVDYKENINVSDLQSGIYFLVAQDDTNVEKIKFIKK